MIHLYCCSASVVGCIYLILLKKLHRTKGLWVSQSHLCSQCESTYRNTPYKYGICGRCLTFQTSCFSLPLWTLNVFAVGSNHPTRLQEWTGGSSGLSENFWPTKKPFQLVSIRFICASNLLNRWILIQRFES